MGGTIGFPDNGMILIPLRNLEFAGEKFTAKYWEPKNPSTITLTLAGDDLSGEIQINSRLTVSLNLKRAAEAAPPYSRENVKFQNGDVTLTGTFFLPTTPGPHPALALVPGSGDILHVGYPFFADFFARRGIASLLYYKRGTNGSTGNWHDVGFEELAVDATAGVHWLQARKDVDPKRVGLFGVSQAGWVAPMAASKSKDIAFLIILSGGGVTVEREGYWDPKYLLKKRGFSAPDVDDAISYYKLSNQVTRTGEGYDALMKKFGEIRPKPWFPLLGVTLPAPPNHSSRVWYKRVIDIDHVPIVKSLDLPALWVYGDDDGDFPSMDAAPIIEKIKSESKKDFEIKIYHEADHFIHVPPPAGSPMPFRKFADGFLDAMDSWLKAKIISESAHD